MIFLKEDSEYLVEMAEIYEALMDLSTALSLLKRADFLESRMEIKEKINRIAIIQGMQLIQMGNARNILIDTSHETFIKRYPVFHKKMLRKAELNGTYSDKLYACLSYLEVNYRKMAIAEI